MPLRLEGHSLVVGLYVLLVSFAGFVGFLLGTYGPEDLRPVSLFFVGPEIQPTAVGLAAYGMVTIGTILGVLLGLVVYASRNLDDASV